MIDVAVSCKIVKAKCSRGTIVLCSTVRIEAAMFNRIAEIAPTKLEMRCNSLQKKRIGQYGVRNHILDVASMMFAIAHLTARAFSSGRTMIFYRAGDRVPRAAAEPPVDWVIPCCQCARRGERRRRQRWRLRRIARRRVSQIMEITLRHSEASLSILAFQSSGTVRFYGTGDSVPRAAAESHVDRVISDRWRSRRRPRRRR